MKYSTILIGSFAHISGAAAQFSVSIPSVVTDGVATTITWADGVAPITLQLGQGQVGQDDQVIAGKPSKVILYKIRFSIPSN
jgi:hypothetical protein